MTTSGNGQAFCFACPAAKALDFTTKICEPCSMGMQAETGASVCSFCPAGSYSKADRSGCLPCPAGRFGKALESSRFSQDAGCTLCPQGTYSGVLGLSSVKQCSSCPRGYYGAPRGSTEAMQCSACPPGKYDDGYGNGTNLLNGCTNCMPGKYNDALAASACKDCEPGTFGSAFGLATKECSGSCTGGEFSLYGFATCLACDAGKYSSDAAAGCEYCERGKTSLPGSSRCVCMSRSFYHEVKGICQPCGAGMQCDEIGEEPTTLQLQDGYWRKTPNSTQVFKCGTAGCFGATNATGDSRCAPGSYGPKCSLCATGFFRNSASRSSSCSQCFEGSQLTAVAWLLFGVLCAVVVLAGVLYLNRHAPAGILRPLLNGVQTTAVMLLFDAPWPEALQQLYQIFVSFNIDILRFAPMSCAVSSTRQN